MTEYDLYFIKGPFCLLCGKYMWGRREGRKDKNRGDQRGHYYGAVIHRIGCGIEKKRKSRMVQ